MFENNLISKSILAGVCIGIGGLANLFVGGIAGAVLFTVGLLAVVHYKFNLFTGKSGFLLRKKSILSLLIILLFNILGVGILGILIHYSYPSIIEKADVIVNSRLSVPYITLCVGSTITGFLMTLSVNFGREGRFLPLLWSVPVFILSGGCHCIADAFYYPVSSIFYNNMIDLLPRYLVIVLFNYLGCILVNLFINKSPLYKEIV